TNNNVYQLGDISVVGNGDGFRRLLLESTVVLRNPMVMAGGG
ncbi:MAG: pilus assembly protein PilW, partial [Aeromonas veronii]